MQLQQYPDNGPNISGSNKFATNEDKLTNIFKYNVHNYKNDNKSKQQGQIMECCHLCQFVRTL